MGRDTVIEATINIGADISAFQSNIKTVQNELNRLNLSSGMKDDFANIFKNLDNEIKNIQQKTSGGKLLAVDEKSVAKSFEKIGQLWTSVTNKISSNKVSGKWLEEDQKAFDNLTALAKQYSQGIKKADSDVMKLSRSLATEEREQAKINKDLETQRKIQQDLNNRLSGKDSIDALNDKLEKQKEFVAQLREEKKLAEKDLKRIQSMTPEEYRDQFKEKHGTARGWNSAYAKEERDAIQKATEATQNLIAAQKEQLNLKKELSTTNTETSNLKRTTERIDQLEKRASEAQERIKNLKEDLGTAKATAFQEVVNQLQKMKDIDWNKYGIDPSTITSYDELSKAIEKIREKGGPEAEQTITKITTAMNAAQAANNGAQASFNATGKSLDQLAERGKEINSLRSRIIQFFSIGNAVRLFRRAIRSAMETVKDLDKVMTETAVVTEFSVGDMWKSLPEYTKRANELGVSIHDVYEASTLYYQQGLETNEVMAVTNATLRMARIASLDAAEATDRVTNALRGFNMEINEANADNIADVYSKLAAISASNVDEISTAMTKVASLANSANMSFENTAAFLAQIIETTRESAETAGTALKTVVARFSEVKDLYSKGELLGTDEEGEEVDVNKVSKALRTAGINLNEFLVGNEGLDEIFMELASKWKDLDIVQQRYIATMAAGSRQQSRFIALMSDYQRTQELTTAAQNASGASLEQYNKTLESLETKLNRLKNAWDQFIMSITNSTIIKKTVDFLTELISKLNKLVDTISGGNGILKAIGAIGIALGGLKLGRSIFNNFFGNTLGQTIPLFQQQGMKLGEAFKTGFKNKATLGKKGLADIFHIGGNHAVYSAADLGIKNIDFSTVSLKSISFDSGQLSQILNEKVNALKPVGQEFDNLTADMKSHWNELSTAIQGENFEKAQEQAQALGLNIGLTAKECDRANIQFQSTKNAVAAMGAVMQTVGSILFLVASAMDKGGEGFQRIAQGVRVFATALMIIPMLLRSVAASAEAAGIAISNIPIIGWIAAIISALVALGVVIHSYFKDQTAEAQAQKAQQALEEAKKATQDAKTAVDNLADSYENLISKADDISKLTKGTEEWSRAVAENNQMVLDLMSKYKELQIVSEDGVLKIINYDEVLADYQNRQRISQSNELGAAIKNTEASIRVLTEKYNGTGFGTEDVMKELGTALATGQILDQEAAQELYRFLYNDENLILRDEAWESLQEFSNGLKVLLPELDNYKKALASQAAATLNLSADQLKYNNVLINSQNEMDQIRKKYEQIYYKGYSSDFADTNEGIKTREDLRKEFYQWAMALDPHAQLDLDTVTVFKGTEQERTYDIRNDSDRTQFISWLQSQRLPEYMHGVITALDQLEKSTNEADQRMAKAFQGINGDTLNGNDVNVFKESISEYIDSLEKLNPKLYDIYKDYGWENLSVADVDKEGTFTYNFIDSLFKELPDYMQKAFNKADWGENWLKANLGSTISYEQALSNFSNKELIDSLNNFKTSTILSFSEQLEKYLPTDNGEFAQRIINTLGLTPEGLAKTGATQQQAEKILEQISTADWTNLRDLQGLKTIFENFGFEIPGEKFKEFIDMISTRVKSLNKIDLSNFKDNVSDIEKAIKDLKEGKQGRIFDKKLYEQIAPFVNPEDFQVTDYGVIYTGEDLDQLGTIIEQGIADGFKEANKILENKISVGEVQKEAKARGEIASSNYVANGSRDIQQLVESGFLSQDQATSLLNEGAERARLKAELDYILQEYDGELSTLGIDDLVDNELNTAVMSTADMQHYLEEITNVALGKKGYKDEQASIEISEIISGGIEKVVQSWSNNSAAAEAALRKLIEDLDVPEEIAKKLLENVENGVDAQQAYDAAKIYDDVAKLEKETGLKLDSDQIYEYAERLQEVKDLTVDVATKTAMMSVKVNTSFKKLLDSYKDWSKLFDEDGPLGKGKAFELGPEQFKVFNEMKKALQDSFNLTGELSDKFFESAENEKLLRTMMTGTVEEQQAAYDQMAKNINEFYTITKEKLQELLKIDVEIDSSNITDFLAEVEGLDPTIQIETLVNMPQFQAYMRTLVEQGGEAGKKAAEAIANAMHLEQKFVPKTKQMHFFDPITGTDMLIDTVVYEMKWDVIGGTTTSSSEDIDWPGVGNVNTNKTSGSSSKPKQWKNPYDELYNKQQEINTALRERERLEHQYQDMLKDHTKTSADLVNNTLKEVAALQKQLQFQKQLLAGRKRQIANVADEIYEDSEGNRASYAALGVTKYATYDAEKNEIQIDYKALSQITDEKIGSAAQAYISQLENYQTEIANIEDTIEELNDNVIEIRQRGQQEYLNFEQKVYDAIVNEREKEIEALEDVSQTIKDAADKTIQSVQDEIDKERQLRENEKEEQSILDKQMRLAYLRRDTSGANALEIKKLEEELANDTQSYQDKIIDQTIQQMQDDAEKAAEQREQQIDLLRQSLELDKATGDIWDKVWEYISEGYDEENGVKEGTALDRVLKLASGYAQMSHFGQLNQIFETNKEAALGMSGLRSWMLTEAKNNGGKLATNDGKAVYNEGKGLWWYKGKHYTDEDFVLDLSTGKMKLGNGQTSTSSQTSETSKSGPHKVIANGVPTEMYDVNDGHVAWTTAGGEQFDLVSEDGEDYIVANEQGARYRTRKKGWKKESGYVWNAYAQGGLVDTTGPAWLDGSKSRPEMVLDAADTRNLITLKNVLASILNNAKSSNANQMGGDNYFNIDIQAEIDSDYDVDQLADRIKKQIYDDASYRNVNVISTMR